MVVALVKTLDQVAEKVQMEDDLGAVVKSFVDLGGLSVFVAVLNDERNERLGLDLKEGCAGGVDDCLLIVDLGVTLDGAGVHEGECTGVAGSAPGGAGWSIPANGEGDLDLGVGIIAEGPESDEVGLHLHFIGRDAAPIVGDPFAAVFHLAADVFAGLGDDVAVVERLDAGLEAESDEEADGNGGDVEEEVAPAMDGLVGWVDVEQGGGLLGRGSG